MFNVEQIGEVIITSVKDIVSAFLVWDRRHCHNIVRRCCSHVVRIHNGLIMTAKVISNPMTQKSCVTN